MIRTDFYAIQISQESASEIRAVGAAGRRLLPEAHLRAEDEKWWDSCVEGIAKGVEQDYALTESGAAPGKTWMLALGYLISGSERILQESVYMGDRVVSARAELVSLAYAVASAVGAIRSTDDDRGDDF